VIDYKKVFVLRQAENRFKEKYKKITLFLRMIFPDYRTADFQHDK
jgi:hypothetical protein